MAGGLRIASRREVELNEQALSASKHTTTVMNRSLTSSFKLASSSTPETYLRPIRIAALSLAFNPHDPLTYWTRAKLFQGLCWVTHAIEGVYRGLLFGGELPVVGVATGADP